MATVNYFLDTRRKKKDGSYPLKLSVNHRKTFYISLNISIPKENWIENRIEGNIKNKRLLNSYIQERHSSIKNLLLRLKIEGKLSSLSAEELKTIILNDGPDYQASAPVKTLLFRDHAEKFIATRESEGTREIYNHTLKVMSRFYDMDKLSFSDIDYQWLETFNANLSATCRTNTRSIHLRNVRAIFRNATKKKLISKDLYPFDDFQIKTEDTMHRDLSVHDLRILRDYEVEPHQEKYRDLFMLSFYLIGINVVDLLHATELRAGRLEYRRAKTKRLYSIKLQPEAMDIIQKYAPGKKYLLNFLDEYENYKDFHRRFNSNLKQIGEMEWIHAKSKSGRGIIKKNRRPLFPFLSSYYARHSWATLAADIDIPEKTIRMALGHGSKTTTDIYINFDMRKVDAANRLVIDYLNCK